MKLSNKFLTDIGMEEGNAKTGKVDGVTLTSKFWTQLCMLHMQLVLQTQTHKKSLGI